MCIHINTTPILFYKTRFHVVGLYSLCKLRIELLNIVPTPLKSWGYKCVLPRLVCVVLEIEAKAPCLLNYQLNHIPTTTHQTLFWPLKN